MILTDDVMKGENPETREKSCHEYFTNRLALPRSLAVSLAKQFKHPVKIKYFRSKYYKK